MNAETLGHQVRRHGRNAKEHPLLELLARAGLVAYGLVYLVLGWLALQVAMEDRDGAVDKTGALRQLADQPMGNALLWFAAVGLLALAVWQGLESVVGHFGRDTKEALWMRARAFFRAAVFAFIGVSAAKVALGHSSRKSTDGYTAWLMSQSLGPWLVGLVGLAVIGFGVGSAVIGLTDRFEKDLDIDGRTGRVGTALAVLARAGYCSRAVAFGVIGSLFVWAAATHDPQRSGGLDQALGRLVKAPLGPAMLLAIAGGFACYGIFNIAKARHLKT